MVDVDSLVRDDRESRGYEREIEHREIEVRRRN